MKTIEEINQHNVKKILSEKKIPDFYPGDVVKVGVRITEGKKERIQYFEGVCIAKKSRDLNSSFTVRKISFGEGVERTFPLYGTLIDSIKVIRSGKVRRAKLYYLRDRKGKSARIAEKIKKKIGIDIETKIQEVTEENVMQRRMMSPPITPTVEKTKGLYYSWNKWRGPGEVTFDPPQVKVWEDTRTSANSPWGALFLPPPIPEDGVYKANATFTEPGEYILWGRADDGGLYHDAWVTVNVSQ